MLSKLGKSISNLFKAKPKVDEEVLNNLLDELLTADVSYEIASEVIEKLSKKFKGNQEQANEIKQFLLSELGSYLNKSEKTINISEKPFVFLISGVNGSGKTTSIGKLANMYISSDKKVIVAACDTFRAAAHSQLGEWANRAKAKFFVKEDAKDPASVAYDSYKAAIKEGFDVLFIDTAGRLHNNAGLMDELSKIKRVLQKAGCLDEQIEHILVLDATTGQHMLDQIENFQKAIPINSLILTKLDGASKGGALISAYKTYKVPISFAGLGEGITDIKPFNKEEFLKQLLDI